MFGKNEIVGKSFFKDANGKLLVTTIFGPTIQGEGPFAGQPAMFVRMARCQLACVFCDTFFDSGEWYTPEEIVERLEKMVPENYPGTLGLVITGGEPTLQNLTPLLELTTNHYEFVQIETNGILPSTVIDDGGYLVVSPKCVEKNGKATQYIKPHEQTLADADCLKFVVTADENSVYHTIPEWAHDWAKQTGRPIFISPMNVYLDEPRQVRENAVKNSMTLEERSIVNEVVSFWEEGLLDREQNKRNHEYAGAYAVKHGYRLNLQMHLYASMA